MRLLCEKTSDDTRHAARSMLASVRRATDLAEDDDITDPVSFAQFLKLTKQHPFLLSPALELAGMVRRRKGVSEGDRGWRLGPERAAESSPPQMRDKVCGSDWWQRLSLERGSAVFLRHAQGALSWKLVPPRRRTRGERATTGAGLWVFILSAPRADYYHHVRGDMNLGQGKPTVAFARVKTPAEKALMEKLVFRDELVEVDVVFRSSATAQALFDVLSIGESVIARRQAARELSSLARGKGSSRDSHRDSIGSSKARVAPTMKIVADDSGAGAGGVARAPPARDARGSSRKIAPSGDKASGHGLRIRAPKP